MLWPLTLSTGATAGQVYKWVDAQGNVHFGSQPPEGQEAASVNPNISQRQDRRPGSQGTEASGEDKEQEKLDEQARARSKREEAKVYCERIRKDLAQMKASPRVRVEENGELRRLTEEERQDRIAKSEASIKENCE